MFDFARPSAAVPGKIAHYDPAGFWAEGSNGWIRQQGAPGRIAIDPAVGLVRGMRTIRLEVHSGDRSAGGERADVYYGGTADPSPAGPTGIRPGAYQWWGWSTRTSPDYRPQKAIPFWNILMDFHNSGIAPQANLTVGVDGSTGALFFEAIGGDPASATWRSRIFHRALGKFVAGKTYRFALGVRWSNDARVGSVALWVNGKRAIPPHHVATLWNGQSAYPKLANYRAPNAATWTNVVWHAGFRRAHSRAALVRCVR